MRDHKPKTTAVIPPRLRLLDERELVAMGVAGSVHTLRSWRTQHRGPKFIKVGSMVRYRLSDVETFLNSLPAGGTGVKVSA